MAGCACEAAKALAASTEKARLRMIWRFMVVCSGVSWVGMERMLRVRIFMRTSLGRW
ncbi:hypothetical protein D3C80_1951910 [compost metagenome]